MPTPQRTSLAEIVGAGREVLETGGPDRVTMQAVAERVGVRAPSLYKRVQGRESLLTLIAAATLQELRERLAAQDSLAAMAHAYRAFAHERPEGFRLLSTRSASAEDLARASEPVLAAARAAVGDADALEAARFMTAWLTGFISMELAGAFRLGGDLDRAFAYGIDRVTAALAG
ncbi:TetR/AcrR family transcriptional regulator [Arthrobacter sp. Sa2BUA2]|uniref:TetR/AcrR family transcriptional regulator n=1 Tax=Arthrobacter pullicola TaxID=2762224 RepID=A0ABR8YGY7_9MICC|nr:TetR/AcrR family transcriptional regulator [Arthrobacter pullicola]MBD8043406.1 TetR/AcrR family transcriptional regulator [Arthrobacter pullicola]